MSRPDHSAGATLVGAALLFGAVCTSSAADSASDLAREVDALRQENQALRQQLDQQQSLIDNLNQRVGTIETEARTGPKKAASTSVSRGPSGFGLGEVRISGEGGVGYFSSQSEGRFPNSEFRVDEARLFVETPVWEDVYFFSELNLATREYDELEVQLGELYVDFESISKLWGQEGQLSLRAGRLDVPFGEEYLYRDVIDNPLISRSLPDLWGVDEGVELYGMLGPIGYVLAVQNGGAPGTRDFNADKSITARLYCDPTSWLHLGLSAMRTGDLDAQGDSLSELWFGGGWFRSIGSTNTTEFGAYLAQGDVAVHFARGHLRAFGGFARYDDNDPLADNHREFYYYSIEGVGELSRKLYCAARFSHILVDGGYPLPGQAPLGKYFFGSPALRADNLWRASFGLGYRFSPRLVLKTEYSFEQGDQINGMHRENVDLWATEAVFGF